MPILPELEINLQRRDDQFFLVGLRYLPVNDEKIGIHNSVSLFRAPDVAPVAAEVNADDYGAKLTEALFRPSTPADEEQPEAAKEAASGKLLQLFHDYRERGKAAGGLRVRLVAPPDLQNLRWETLFDPEKPGEPLLCGGGLNFSRYLSSPSAKPLRSRPKGDMRALVVIADPPNARVRENGVWRPLAAVQVEKELERAEAVFAGAKSVKVDVVKVVERGKATLSAPLGQLRENIDILYLVCHGALIGGEPCLWLDSENPDPRVYMPVRASELVTEIGKLDHPPRLVVFASCQSADAGRSQDKGALAGIGPRLISEAGVGAVVAMQGDVQMDTVKTFMPTLFKEILTDGQIDKAMAVARGDARRLKCSDYWMPALFTGMQNCAMWYEPGFAGQTFSDEVDKKAFWDTLCGDILKGNCVPIIGPDLAEHIFGSTRTIARTLADANGYPFSGQDRVDLAKVSQFICTRDRFVAMRRKVREAFNQQFKANATALVPGSSALRMDLIRKLAATDGDPLRIVASLNAKVYVTAATDSLLEDLLKTMRLKDGSERKPRSINMKWRDERRRADETMRMQTQTEQFQGDPTDKEPYLYYIFGQRSEAADDSWVLTEDDVFDYLIQTSKYDLMPQPVACAMGSNSLLFLGFPLDDWKFRVLFRMILAIEGNAHLGGRAHVGVQIDPDQATLTDAHRAKKYLEDYFSNPSVMRESMSKPSISIYWGSSADFLRDLNEALKTAPPPSEDYS